MAITAAMTVSSATCNTQQKVACTCTVTNSGASAVNVTSLVPTYVISGTTQVPGGANLGQPNIGPGMTVAVAASGTLALNFDFVPMAPQVGTYSTNPFPSSGVGGVAITPLPPEALPQSLVYAVGALVTTSDGSSASASTTTITVSAVRP